MEESSQSVDEKVEHPPEREETSPKNVQDEEEKAPPEEPQLVSQPSGPK